MSGGTRLTGQAGRDRAASLLENDDEAEVKHLSRLLKHPPPFAGKEVVVVTWRGGWLCLCGRACWAKQHCKACGQWSPCRDWLFAGGCGKANCKFPHPQFFLPRQRPPVGPDEHTAADGEELIRLPPPGSVPACELARRKRAAAAAAAAEPQRAAAAPAPAPASASSGPSAASSGPSAGMWADLEARARAAMDSATTGSGASSLSATPAPAAPAAQVAGQRQPVAAAAAALLPAAPGPGGTDDDAEVAEYLAMLGIA